MFAVGDCAFSGNAPTAQVAAQQGKWLGRRLRDGDLETAPHFKYSHLGSMAYVGDRKAVAQVTYPMGLSTVANHFWWRLLWGPSDGENDATSQTHTLTGSSGFFLWRSVYFSKLLSFNNRLKVANDWMRVEAFGRDVATAQAIMERSDKG